MTTAPLRPEPERDRYGRYILPDPKTGKRRSWTRATTWAQTIADTYALNQWQKRMVALGLAQRPDLLAQVATVLEPDAEEHAGASQRSNLGTALHSFLEHLDLGREVQVPEPWDQDVAAYRQTLKA